MTPDEQKYYRGRVAPKNIEELRREASKPIYAGTGNWYHGAAGDVVWIDDGRPVPNGYTVFIFQA